MPSNDELLYAIRQRLDFEALFRELGVELLGRGSERRAKCAFHEDSNPSMSVNVEEGQFLCHNPECAARGDFLTFYMRKTSMSFMEAVHTLARRVGVDPSRPMESIPRTQTEEAVLASYTPPAVVRTAAVVAPTDAATPIIDEAIVNSAHARLVATDTMVELLGTRRGLSRATIDQYQLGHDGRRFYIPIRNEAGQCVNIRQYLPDARQAHMKMISWRQGFGIARLFPITALAEDSIYLLEGEMDTLLARQVGLNAMTTTGGAGTWRDEWNDRFVGKNVVVCYDCDAAGRRGAAHVASKLLDIAASVKVVVLPLAEPVGADFTDFVVGHGHSKDDFLRLVDATTPFVRPAVEPEAPDEDPEMVHLSQASRAEFYNHTVKFNALVSGKTMSPHLVPKEVRMSCRMPGIAMCERCPVSSAAGQLTHRVEYESNDLLHFINVTDDVVVKKLKSMMRIPAKCQYVGHEITEAQNVEEIQIIPEIDRSEADTPYVTRMAYHVGHGLETNRSYLMTALTVPDPKKQIVTHIATAAIPAQSNIDSFALDSTVKESLQQFQPRGTGVDDLWRKLDEIYDDLEKHTRIYQRRDLMLAVDLTFHSVVRFVLQGELLARGWTEALVIGDSRTGKTTIVSRMIEHYGAGELSSGENTTLAGLVGGLHQMGSASAWALRWGKVPLNDRRLLFIDEAGNLPQEQIARMSSMRSSGIVEVTKIHTERTNARTRQIWVSNPRSPRPLSTFSQGVLAVKELIGAPEDIARFDLIVTAASSDVSLDVVNAPRGHESPQTFTRQLCHQRVMFAWSRRSEQVQFTPEGLTLLLRVATEMGQKYKHTTEIPIVEPNEQRVKLARLAVAAAALFYSTDDTGQNVIVCPQHVEFAGQFLERLYAKPSLAFDEYAAMQRRRFEVTNEAAVTTIISRRTDAAQSLMEQEQLTQRDLLEILGFDDRDALREAITTLRDAGFLRRQGSSFYVKTSGANAWLRRYVSLRNGHGGGAVGRFAIDSNGSDDLAEVGDDPPW